METKKNSEEQLEEKTVEQDWKCILCGTGICSCCIDKEAELFFNKNGDAICICKDCLNKEAEVGAAS